MIENIKADLLQARKDRNTIKSSVLSTLVGEVMSKAVMVEGMKTVTNDVTVSMIKKFIKGIDETLEHAPDNESLKQERIILEQYLPKMLTEAELSNITTEAYQAGNKNIGSLMAYLKTNYPNQYDGKLASQVANTILKKD